MVKLDDIPKSWEKKLMLYCAHLVTDRKVQSATLKSYVSAIKQTLLTDGYQWNHNLFMISTFTESCQLENDVLTTRLPIQKRLLETILFEVGRMYKKQNYLEILYKTMFCFAYYGLLRIGEIANGDHPIKVTNVHLSKDRTQLLVILYTSKTHGRRHRPQKVTIKAEPRIRFCPVKLANLYSEMRESYSSPNENYFMFSDGYTPVEPHHVRNTLKRALKNLGLKEYLYDTHSFRIGRATDLEKMGSHSRPNKETRKMEI